MALEESLTEQGQTWEKRPFEAKWKAEVRKYRVYIGYKKYWSLCKAKRGIIIIIMANMYRTRTVTWALCWEYGGNYLLCSFQWPPGTLTCENGSQIDGGGKGAAWAGRRQMPLRDGWPQVCASHWMRVGPHWDWVGLLSNLFKWRTESYPGGSFERVRWAQGWMNRWAINMGFSRSRKIPIEAYLFLVTCWNLQWAGCIWLPLGVATSCWWDVVPTAI